MVSKLLRMFDFTMKSAFYYYHAIHIDVFSGQAILFADISSFFAHARQKKVILNLHGGRLDEFEAQNSGLVRRVLDRADKIVTPSKYLKNHFTDIGYDVEYLPNSFDIEKFPYSPPKDNRKLLWVRGFSHIYRPELAVEAMEKLGSNYSDVTLTMVGPDKGMLEPVMKMIQEKGLGDRIDIVGAVSNQRLGEYYREHAIFLNTTSYESFGIAVMEAAASGIPVLSTGVGEIPLLWRDTEEIFIAEPTPDHFARKIEQLLDSPDLRKRASEKARRRSESYSWENLRPQWQELLNGIHV